MIHPNSSNLQLPEIQWNDQNNKWQWYIHNLSYSRVCSIYVDIRIGSDQSSFGKLVITLKKKTNKKMFLSKGFLWIRFLRANTNILNLFMCTYTILCVWGRKKIKCGIEIVTYIDCTFVLLGLQQDLPAALHRASRNLNLPLPQVPKYFYLYFIECTYITCHLINSEI